MLGYVSRKHVTFQNVAHSGYVAGYSSVVQILSRDLFHLSIACAIVGYKCGQSVTYFGPGFCKVQLYARYGQERGHEPLSGKRYARSDGSGRSCNGAR